MIHVILQINNVTLRGEIELMIELGEYIKDNIGDGPVIKEWEQNKLIPIYLQENYKFYEMQIMGIDCLLLAVISENIGFTAMEKHISKIQEITEKQIVLYYKQITTYRRKTLIRNRIPFYVEGGQFFLPFLGLNILEKEEKYQKKIKKFSPSSQLTFLYFLYKIDTCVNATKLAEIFNWSKMTASRSLNELYNANLLTYKIGGETGKSKIYSRITDPDYFKIGQEFLRSPIRKKIFVNEEPKSSLTAGLEALANRTMLNPPRHKVRAMYIDNFDKESQKIIENQDIINDQNLLELELWTYDPYLFAEGNRLDVASLYASLRENNDERIEQALKEVLRGMTWYQD